jgi:hypothetical protein
VAFAQARALRPRIVGEALREIGRDPEIANALFQMLETQGLLEGGTEIVLVPQNRSLQGDLLAADPIKGRTVVPPPPVSGVG